MRDSQLHMNENVVNHIIAQLRQRASRLHVKNLHESSLIVTALRGFRDMVEVEELQGFSQGNSILWFLECQMCKVHFVP